jgi:hypothetical protein
LQCDSLLLRIGGYNQSIIAKKIIKKKSYILAWSVSDDFILTLPETSMIFNESSLSV